MISISAFAFVFCHPGYAFQHAFNNLYASVRGIGQKEEDIGIHTVAAPFLPDRANQK
jgi:hypothetical protein